MRAVLERDFLSQVGRGRTFAVRTTVGGILAAVVLLFLGEGLEASNFRPDEIGASVFLAGSVAFLSLIAVLTPPVMVGSILQERQEETLPLVLAAPVSARAFALAKLLARTGVVLTWALATVPCLVLPVLFGGVSGEQVLDLALLGLAIALEMGAWALWVSSHSRRFATAAVLSYLLPLTRWVGTLSIASILDQSVFRAVGSPASLYLLPASTPLASLLPALGAPASALPGVEAAAVSWGGVGALLVRHPAWIVLAVAAAGAAGAVVLAGERLLREAEPTGGFSARTATRRRWFRRPPGRGNPLSWKEARLLNASGSRTLYYTVFALLLLVFIGSFSGLWNEGSMNLAMALEGTALSLVAVVNGAATFGHEKARGGFDLLRITLLSPRDLARGKGTGVLRGLQFLFVVPAAHILLALALGSVGVPWAAVALGCIVLVTSTWAFVGLRCGVAAPTVRSAVVRATLLFGGTLVLLPVLSLVLLFTLRVPEEWAIALFTASPPVTLGMGLHQVHALLTGPGGGVGATHQENWAVAWLAAGAAFGLAEWFALPGAVARRLERERESG